MWRIMAMEIRLAGPADIPGIIAVGRATWPVAYAFAGADHIAEGLARWWSEAAITEIGREVRWSGWSA
jgi:hypothetical protein